MNQPAQTQPRAAGQAAHKARPFFAEGHTVDGPTFSFDVSTDARAQTVAAYLNGYHAEQHAKIAPLVAALEAATAKLSMWPEGSNPEFFPCMKQARAALAAAK